MTRHATTSYRRPDHWPELETDPFNPSRTVPLDEVVWEDAWGIHTFVDPLLTTDYADPEPVAMVAKRKHRRP